MPAKLGALTLPITRHRARPANTARDRRPARHRPYLPLAPAVRRAQREDRFSPRLGASLRAKATILEGSRERQRSSEAEKTSPVMLPGQNERTQVQDRAAAPSEAFGATVTFIRLWSPAAREDRRGGCVSVPARAPSLSHHAPPTHTNRVLGPVTLQTEVTEGRTGGHPSFFKALSPRDTKPCSARGMHPHKSTEKRGRKEHLTVTRLPWQRAAPGGKWWRPALAPRRARHRLSD